MESHYEYYHWTSKLGVPYYFQHYPKDFEFVKYSLQFYDIQFENKVINREEYYDLIVNFGQLSKYNIVACKKFNAQLITNMPKEEKMLNKTSFPKLKFLLVIIPKDSREEFVMDLRDIVNQMKEEHCSKAWIGCIVALQFASVVYHGIFFKLSGYFYSKKQTSKGD